MRVAVMLAALVLLSGCAQPRDPDGTATASSSTSAGQEPGPTVPSGNMTILRHAGCGGMTSRNVTAAEGHLVRTQAELEAIWPRVCGELATMPTVAFASESVLVHTWGQRPSGGQEARILAVTGDGTALEATVRHEQPAPGCPSAAVITYPGDAVVVPAVPAVAVTWRVEDVQRPCL